MHCFMSCSLDSGTALLTLHSFSPSCSSFLSLPCIFLLLFSINSFCFGSSFFVDCCSSILLFVLLFICQQTASCTLTCWHSYCHYLNDSTASLLLFWCPSLLLFSWILLFLWQFLDLIMLCLSGASLLFGFVSLFSHFSIVLYSVSSINIYALFVIHLIITLLLYLRFIAWYFDRFIECIICVPNVLYSAYSKMP